MLVNLIKEQFCNLKFEKFPLCMLIFMSISTFISPNNFTFTGICIAFMLIFSQINNHICPSEECASEVYMTSRYLFYLILLHIGLAWLVGLMWLKSAVLGHIFWTTQIIDTLFMAYCIDMALVSLLVPISLLLDKQTTQIFSILALMVGMSVMLFTHSLIVSHAFTASQFPAMFTFPTVIFLFSLLNFRKVFKEKSCC